MRKSEQGSANIGFTSQAFILSGLAMFLLLLALPTFALAQDVYEGKKIANIEVTFEGDDKDESTAEQFRLIASEELGEEYSAVKVRDTIQKLYDTDRVIFVSVNVSDVVNDQVYLNIKLKRKPVAQKITVNVDDSTASDVTEQEIRLRVSLINPGDSFSERDINEASNNILTYLRDRGYYQARVTHDELPQNSPINVEVVFNVFPGQQTKVGQFNIDIADYDSSAVKSRLTLQPGAPYSQEALMNDVDTIRSSLSDEGYMAPRLDEPRQVYDSDNNLMDVTVRGTLGAKVVVSVNEDKEKISDKTKKSLLPIMREGTLDYGAIVEGERRLENYFQERGYFFADATPICSVTPKLESGEASETENDTTLLCTALSGADLTGREVSVTYEVDMNRRLKLTDVRVDGSAVFTEDEITPMLETQAASPLGFIPFIGYGRGYTSLDLLEQDRETIRALLNEVGYRNAQVNVLQGVSPNGEDLIITFYIREGASTKIGKVEFEGNSKFTDSELLAALPKIEGKQYSRALIKTGQQDLSNFYSNKGFYDATISVATSFSPAAPGETNDNVELTYRVVDEGRQVVINRILIVGNERTKREAILNAINLKPDSFLRQADIFSSEQSLYGTDAFSAVEIKAQPAGETADGKYRQSDIIINLQEDKPRLITYGGGYSTDTGWSGFFDIRHFNLFGSLKQGGGQIRLSQRQQLIQFDFLNPRFIKDGIDENGVQQFAPLTLSLQYQRDSTVTRFFRSTFDQGTYGIVQRIDENGVPVDQYGIPAGDPTINRATISLETSKTISRKSRSIVFLKYRYEDVRLLNYDSLLIEDVLQPDSHIRISGFSTTYVRDTRKNCSVKNTMLDIINTGVAGDPCKYNAGDPTDGDYLTAEFSTSIPALGANIGFTKLQLSYNNYFTVHKLRNTTFAGRAILGMGYVFSNRDRYSQNWLSAELDGLLPISERFFAGGSTTLRGFQFETAGPRVVITPQGTFHDQQGNVVDITPFLLPFGGNALVITNFEARVPISDSIRLVPFYDGGNVYGRPTEIFNPRDEVPSDAFLTDLRAVWTHTVGLGFRVKTPIGGEFAIDYGYLLNPPSFIIPEPTPPDSIIKLHQGEFHFRFSQAF
ncbi:MAG: POTRA domain-containing protein [Pyrinomonadaceae bacterium]